MYANLPKRDDLFPHLGSLEHILHSQLPSDRVSALTRELEQLTYHIRGACASLLQLEAVRNELIKTQATSLKPSHSVMLVSEAVDPLSFALDGYLHFVRRGMDGLVLYLRRATKGSKLPASFHHILLRHRTSEHLVSGSTRFSGRIWTQFVQMNGVGVIVKGIEKRRWPELNNKITDITLHYWNNINRRLKGYRDQSNHTAIVSSNCTLLMTSDSRYELRLQLPDDPEERSPSKLRYDPGIPAMTFVVNSLTATIKYANDIVERLIDLNADDPDEARCYSLVLTPIRGAPIRIGGTVSGEPVPYPIDIKQIVNEATKDISGAHE